MKTHATVWSARQHVLVARGSTAKEHATSNAAVIYLLDASGVVRACIGQALEHKQEEGKGEGKGGEQDKARDVRSVYASALLAKGANLLLQNFQHQAAFEGSLFSLSSRLCLSAVLLLARALCLCLSPSLSLSFSLPLHVCVCVYVFFFLSCLF